MADERGKRAGRFGEQMRSLRQEQLVRAACNVLLRKGCSDLRVEDAAAACGVAKGTCYQHFGTRSNLVAAAVGRLDEALAERLLSPPACLTKPRQILEWAVFEALDAEGMMLERRTRQVKPEEAMAEGKAWPCCLGSMPCPYGGAARSLEALRHWTMRGRSSRHRDRASFHMTLLLAVAPLFVWGLGHHSRPPNTRHIRSLAGDLFNHLFQ